MTSDFSIAVLRNSVEFLVESNYKIELVTVNIWNVSSDSNTYKVEFVDNKLVCTCPGFTYRRTCKHLGMIPRDQLVVKHSSDSKRFSRSVIEKMIPDLKKIFDKYGIWEIAGSYRRKVSTCKDIDLLVVVSSLSGITSELDHTPEFVKTTSGSEILRGYYKGIPIDILRVNKDEYATYLLYRTGSAEFNIRMRGIAKRLGYKLNEHGLFDLTGSRVLIQSEKDVFDKLGMDYLEPEKRN